MTQPQIRRRVARRYGLAATAFALAIAGCTAHATGHGSGPSAPAGANPSGSTGQSAPSTSPSTSGTTGCPATYAAPDPKRPKVRLAFTVSPDLTRVQGSEHIEFTPDLPITELVFRLTANTGPTVAAGNKIVVTSAKADHGAGPPTFALDGADPSTQGGLLRIPFASPDLCRDDRHGRPRIQPDSRRRVVRPLRAGRYGRIAFRVVRVCAAAARLGTRVRLAYRADDQVHGRERHQRGDADRSDRDRACGRQGHHVR